jgi:hypothetical protein
MPYEKIEVRISPKGEILVRIDGADEQRLRDFRAFLEEVIGPIGDSSRVDGPAWERVGEIAAEDKTKTELGTERRGG